MTSKRETIARSDLELVLAIDSGGSLATTSLSLNIAPSAVTKRLAALEAHLRQRLFQRTTRRVSATPEGQTLCERAHTLLAGLPPSKPSCRSAKPSPPGYFAWLRRSGSGVCGWCQRLPRFKNATQATGCRAAAAHRAVARRSRDGFDGAIWLWSARGARASQWVSRPVAPNQRVLVASPSYLKQRGQPQSLDIAPHLDGGQLVRILPAWSMPDADIHWLAPYRAEVPRRIRLRIDLLRSEFETEPWKSTVPAAWPPAPPG